MLNVGETYYAYATNSAAGNIQIITVARTSSTGVRSATPSPHLPAWAAPGATWAPSVLQVGDSFVLYYSADYPHHR